MRYLSPADSIFTPVECLPGVPGRGPETTMPHTLEISDELAERLDRYVEEDQTYEELIEELVSMYEAEGAFLREGYSE